MARNDLSFENAEILFRNFRGLENDFNEAGKRNFCVIVPDEIADELNDEGWNIRVLKPRDEGDTPRHYMQVKVSYKNIPPKIWLIRGRHKTLLDEDTIDELDFADIENVDLIIRPYHWNTRSGASGIAGYVDKMYVTIQEDVFANKYDFEEEELPFD